jgi:hypothetical protein
MASTVNITIDKGSSFEWVFSLQQTHLLLSGAAVYAQMRQEYEAGNTISFAASLADTDVTISLTSAQTANATMVPGTWVYDVYVVDESNNAIRVVQGLARVKPRVTTLP